MALPLQRIEGKYEILQRITEGGMGAVYRVRHRLLGDERVVKVMRPPLASDQTLRERFLREARAVSRLAHPNIAQIYDFTADDQGFAYIVMEYVRGLTFEELRGEGLPPVSFLLDLAQQSLRALGYLHRNGLIHRDVSPDNLMLTRDVEGGALVKLIDLGIAKAISEDQSLTATGMFLGKIRYAAPEQFYRRDEAPLTPACDIYALAVVIYELLTGCYPVVGEKTSSLIAGHLFRPPIDFAASDPHGRVPAAVRQVIVKALEKRPEDRFDSAERMAEALAASALGTDRCDAEVERLLRLVASRPPSLGAATAGGTTTQTRLDDQFQTDARTPVPTAVGPLTQSMPQLTSKAEKLSTRPGAEPITELVTRARELSSIEAFDEARATIAQALDLVPDHREANEMSSMIATIEQVEQQSRQEAGALAVTLSEIQSLIDRRRPGDAMKLLHPAMTRFGDLSELQALRHAAAEVFLEDDPGDETLPTLVDARRPRFESPTPPPQTSVPSEPRSSEPRSSEPRPTVPSVAPTPPIAPVAPASEPAATPIDPTLRLAALPGLGGPASGSSEALAPASVADLPLAAAVSAVEPSLEPQQETATGLDLTSLKTWLMIGLVAILCALAGMWVARLESGTAEPEIEIEDVIAPAFSESADDQPSP